MARKRRLSKKARAAALRNLAKARRARKRGKRRVVREAAETPRRRRKRRHAKKRAHTKRRRKHVAAAAPRRRRRRVAKAAPRRRRRRHAKEAPHQIRRSRKSGRFTRRKKYGRHTTKLVGHITGESRRRRRRRKGYAMENPLSAVELVVGGLTMLVGAGAADVLDRFLATHALQVNDAANVGKVQGAIQDNGAPDGAYKGLFNAAAIEAPMDWKRWLGGAGVVLVPFAASGMVKSGAGRSALQLFSFGALVRVGGKAAKDLVAKLTKTTATGQRLYDASMRAAALKAGDGSEASLVSTGLGARRLGCGRCNNCRTGVGACCYQGGASTAPATPPAPSGGGMPPGFYEPPPPVINPSPQPLPAPTPAPAPVPPPAPGPGFTGVPRHNGMGSAYVGSRLNWGAPEDNVD